jgi:hypothetical protein
MRWIKHLPLLFLLAGCETSAETDPFESRMHTLMRRKDSLVRVRNTEEKKLGSYEKGKTPQALMTDTAYMSKAEIVVNLDRQISFVTHEIRQIEKERLANQQLKK